MTASPPMATYQIALLTREEAQHKVADLLDEVEGLREQVKRLERDLALAPLEHASNLLYVHSRGLANRGEDREPILVHVRALNAAIDAARRAP